MLKCDFNKVELHTSVTFWYGCLSVNLQHIFRIRFPKNIWRAASKGERRKGDKIMFFDDTKKKFENCFYSHFQHLKNFSETSKRPL